jgi:hypothetical protein
LLLDLGFSHRSITLMLIAFNILVILLNYGLRQYGSTILVLGTVALFFLTIAIIYFPLRSKRAAILATDNQSEGLTQPTLVSFSNKPLVDQKN